MLRYSVLFISALLFSFHAQAQFQQFGSTKSIPHKSFEIGANPFIMIHNGDNPKNYRYSAMNVYGGYGINDKIDLRATAGVMMINYDNAPDDYNPTNTYFGIEFEGVPVSTGKFYSSGFELALAGGVHAWQNHAGFDAAVKLGLRGGRKFHAYTGIDADMNYYIKDEGVERVLAYRFLYRVPVSMEISPNPFFSIVLETGVPLSEYDHFVVGGGLRFYIIKK